MKKSLNHNSINHGSPLIVELVGLAGTGKTTLSRALRRRNKKILMGPELELRKIKHIPIFIKNSSHLLPVFLRQFKSDRQLNWDEIKAIVYLKAWPKFLKHQVSEKDNIILLDHGPIFKLSTLNAFGPENLKNQYLEHWWNKMLEQWAIILDVVIMLNAPDVILMERINNRAQRHAVKGKSEQEVYDFLTRYKISYQQILEKLAGYKQITVLEFDTTRESSEQIADVIVSTCISRLNSS